MNLPDIGGLVDAPRAAPGLQKALAVNACNADLVALVAPQNMEGALVFANINTYVALGAAGSAAPEHKHIAQRMTEPQR